jgi:hypothetical protein
MTRLALAALLLLPSAARAQPAASGRCATYAIEGDGDPVDGDRLHEELEKLGLQMGSDPDLRLSLIVRDDPAADETQHPTIFHGQVCASASWSAWDTASLTTLLPKFCVNHGVRTYSEEDARANGRKLWRAQEAEKFRKPLMQKLGALLQQRSAGLTIESDPTGAQLSLERPNSRFVPGTPHVVRCLEPGTVVAGTVTRDGRTGNVQGKAVAGAPTVTVTLAKAPPDSDNHPSLSCFDDPSCARRWLWGGGAGAALLLGAGVVWWRRRITSQSPREVEPSIINTVTPTRPEAFIFISYSRPDQASAETLHRALSARGLPAWFDKQQLTAGDRWPKEIELNLDRCALFVPLVSANSLGRDEGFFVKEWRGALDRWRRMKNRAFLVPVIVDGELTAERIKEDEVARDFLDAVQVVRAPGGQASPADLDSIAALLTEQKAKRAANQS